MKILTIGGCHAYGYGVPEGESFTERVAQDLRAGGQAVEVGFLAPVKMKKLLQLLQNPAFRPNDYDLILLQLGHFELLNQETFWNYFKPGDAPNPGLYGTFTPTFDCQTRPQPVAHLRGGVLGKRFLKDSVAGPSRGGGWVRQQLKRGLLNAMCPFYEIPRLKRVRRELSQILTLLRPYHRCLLVLAPLPSMNPLVNTLRRLGGRVFREECRRQNVCVLDAFGVLEGQPHFFTTDGFHLNELGHHLLALEITALLNEPDSPVMEKRTLPEAERFS